MLSDMNISEGTLTGKGAQVRDPPIRSRAAYWKEQLSGRGTGILLTPEQGAWKVGNGSQVRAMMGATR